MARPHVVIVPSPGMGHLIPLAEHAKRLANHHHCSVTILIPTIGPPSEPQNAVLDALSPLSIQILFLPPVSFHDLPDGAPAEIKIVLAVTRSVSHIRDWFKSATSKPAALLVDMFGTDAIDVGTEFGVPSYICFLSAAVGLSLLLHVPELAETVSCEYRDLPEPVKLPGCIPIRGSDFPDPLQDRENIAHQLFVRMSKRISLANGVLINTFVDLEPGVLRALQEKEPGKPPVYPVGPLIQTGPGGGGTRAVSVDGSGCLKWLNEQPIGSVLFVSFGSGGTLSHEQVIELAIGLEMSGTRFLWVARTPDEKLANGSFFDVQGGSGDALSFLPNGFLERTRGRGLVVPSWAPQIEVLSHRSTGGFLSHCGWNSVLESIVHGVPLIAWPLYAEQKLNAAMLSEDAKVALRPKGGENGVVGREEVCEVVKELMEGEEGGRIRERIGKLKDGAAMAVGEDGSSTKSLSQLVLTWNKMK